MFRCLMFCYNFRDLRSGMDVFCAELISRKSDRSKPINISCSTEVSRLSAGF